jgi:cyclophilin family peptidyl-prolyl cis-trans isomerase
MNHRIVFLRFLTVLGLAMNVVAAPAIDPIGPINIPAGKSLIIPITATSPNGRPLTFTVISSTNRIAVAVSTNNTFWKMSVVQAAPANAPGAFQTPFRGGVATVTNIGDMTFMLFRDAAPRTVDALQGLTTAGFYTSNTIFHRVVPGFVIQGGDPNTNGTGGPVFRYDDEYKSNALFTGNGQLAMANSGKDTDGSQFFITAGPQRALDFGYTICGQLLRGFEVLTNILNTPTNGASRPLADVIITRASFVPDYSDTVLALTGTNYAGVAGTIYVIADDGAGGRATNFFTATTSAETQNDPPFLYPNTVTNLVVPVNGRLTNIVSAFDPEGDAFYWFKYYNDQNSSLNASNTIFSVVNGQLQMVVVPNTNYVGPLAFYIVVSYSSIWNFFPTQLPYDAQVYAFAVGDTVISVFGTNFIAPARASFTNQVLATFTNGVFNSPATNFTAFINWGDNSTNSGVIVTNLNWKEVRGAHMYTNAGTYPVYVTIQSALGFAATAMSAANVPPAIALARTGNNNTVTWPAWAADYNIESNTSLASANWGMLSNYPALNGYDLVLTNSTTNGAVYFRLRK